MREEMGFLKDTLSTLMPGMRIGKDKKGLFNLLLKHGVRSPFAVVLLERSSESVESLRKNDFPGYSLSMNFLLLKTADFCLSERRAPARRRHFRKLPIFYGKKEGVSVSSRSIRNESGQSLT